MTLLRSFKFKHVETRLKAQGSGSIYILRTAWVSGWLISLYISWKAGHLCHYIAGRIFSMPGITVIRKVPSRSIRVASKILLD